MASDERETPALRDGGDVVERVPRHVQHSDRDADHGAQTTQQLRIAPEATGGAAGMFVADDAQRGEPSLRASRDGVIESVPPTVDVPRTGDRVRGGWRRAGDATPPDGRSAGCRPRARRPCSGGRRAAIPPACCRCGRSPGQGRRSRRSPRARRCRKPPTAARASSAAWASRVSGGRSARSSSSSPGLAGGVLGPPASDGGAEQAMGLRPPASISDGRCMIARSVSGSRVSRPAGHHSDGVH